MEPWQSWTVMLVGGGAAWWYYNSQKTRRPRAGRSISEKTAPRATRRGEGRRKIDGGTTSQNVSGSDTLDVHSADSSATPRHSAAKRRKSKQREDTQGNASSAQVGLNGTPSKDRDEPEEVVDNREFAKQLSGLKAGSTLAPPVKAGAKQRTLKQSRVNNSSANLNAGGSPGTDPASQNVSTNSSTTGADADDDWSPAASPALDATFHRQQATAGDYSDMLEAPAAGPSVLRLTEPAEPARTPRQHQSKPQQPTETKKQRQNRKKVEEKKAARENAEKERRQLLEKQLRTAREAEGRPAKNGLGSSQAPQVSAWTAPSMAVDERTPTTTPLASNGALLDTFGPETPTEGANGTHVRANGAGKPDTDSTPSWGNGLPSEEEQMRMIKEMNHDAGWNTVAKGKKGKKKAVSSNGNITGNESSENDRSAGNSGDGTKAGSHLDSDWAVVN